MDGIEVRVARQDPSLEPRRGSRGLAGSIPSSSAGTGTRAAGGASPAADIHEPLLPAHVRRPSRAGFFRGLLSIWGTAQRAECSSHVLEEVGEPPRDHTGTPHEHHGNVCAQCTLLSSIRLAQTPPAPISYHGATDASTDGEADPPPTRQWPPQHHKARSSLPDCPAERAPGFPRPVEAGRSAAEKAYRKESSSLRYTVSRLRPLARRRFSTFRPPCVFIRWRNPCVLARRRLFG